MSSKQHFPWTQEAHKTFQPFLGILFVISVVYAFFYNTWAELVIIGLPALVMPIIFIRWQPESAWSRHAVAFSAMVFSALHIHQMQGLIEIHFGIFAYLAALVFYRDWRIIVSAVLIVLIYHVAFFVMQMNAVPVYLFEQGHLSFNILVLHAFYAILEGAVLIHISRRMHSMGLAGAELEFNINQKMANENSVKLGHKANTHGRIRVLEQFNDLFSYIDQLAVQAKQSVIELDTQADELKGNVLEISKLKSLESKHTESMASSTEQMSNAIAEVAQRANQASEQSELALDAVEKTDRAIDTSIEDINQFEKTLKETSRIISSLSDSSNQVTSVVEAIQAIAEQTNLLALNAAIESARAGEHGRGFSVVADEVRQLSFRTKESTTQITQILKSLVQHSQDSVSSMQTSLTQLDKMLKSSYQMQSYVDEATASVKKVDEHIELVAKATEEQASSAHDIALNGSEINKIAENERAYLEHISASSIKVHQLTEALRRALLKFD